MLFSLIHPSRERCDLAVSAFSNWINKASGKHDIEYFISVDEDDSQLDCYKAKFPKDVLLIHPNRSIVDAVNVAAAKTKGDCIIVMSDDFDCPEDWDELLFREALSDDDDLPIWHYAIHVNDGLQMNTMTLPIVSRSVYEKLKHIYHPGYFSMFADNEITEVCEELGVMIKAPHLLFKHNHYTVTGQKPDATYQRENSNFAYTMGEKLFNDRKAKHFDLNA